MHCGIYRGVCFVSLDQWEEERCFSEPLCFVCKYGSSAPRKPGLWLTVCCSFEGALLLLATCHWILSTLTSGYAMGECDIHLSPLTWFDLLTVLMVAIESFGFHDSQLWRLAIQPFPFPEILCFLGCWRSGVPEKTGRNSFVMAHRHDHYNSSPLVSPSSSGSPLVYAAALSRTLEQDLGC